MSDPCPVCGDVLTRETDYMDYTLMEELERCDFCGYVYEFITGNYHERIGDREWGWTYNETRDEEKLRTAEVVNASADPVRNPLKYASLVCRSETVMVPSSCLSDIFSRGMGPVGEE